MHRKRSKFLEDNSLEIVIDNKLLKEDINYTITHKKTLLEKFRKKNIVVTGANGLIAHILILTLLVANEAYDLQLSVIGIARNKDKVKESFGININAKALHFIYQDIRDEINVESQVDFVFHTAAVTSSKALIQIPVEAFETQIIGTINVLHFAKKHHARVLYLSSMEIYGKPTTNKKIHEEDLGYVDPLIIRNGYPEGKRGSEFLGSAFYNEYGVHVVNARIAQTFGPGVSKNDTRVFAQFIRSAINKEDIVLYTDGSSLGNYCYMRDTINALLLLIVQGRPGEAYNVVNENTNMSIKEMAEMVSKTFGNGVVRIEVPKKPMGYAVKVNLHMSSDKIRKLGWQPHFDLEEMFERTIKSFDS